MNGVFTLRQAQGEWISHSTSSCNAIGVPCPLPHNPDDVVSWHPRGRERRDMSPEHTMTLHEKPFVAITMGDPAGVGAEVTVKALQDGSIYEKCRPFVVGNVAAIDHAIEISGLDASGRVTHGLEDVAGEPGVIDVMDPENLDYSGIELGELSASAGKAAVEWVLHAGEMAAAGDVQAIVTAPINKEAAKLAGYKDIGHMEIFQSQTNSKEVATMLMADVLRVVHLTTHRQLRIACDYVTIDNVLAKVVLTHEHFVKWGFPTPRIGVSALNPHASDGGLLGDEEEKQITPAIDKARSLGIDATGPVPPDTVFTQAINGKYDVVLAMYHDQGHIPIKVHNWERSVSVNLGLPFIRTSVDHGTAFDIAGQGIAHHESMAEAIGVAVDLASDSKLR
ncbi:MAG: 4-hydroxythreonine-4-phosphate dehydrogenase PdxA [Dehalococcoidia bacterium]|nr:4-hydroxythreonine-4-phosphate dehydrogenase PdxA [Dehalococcoidia bacterium]